MNKHNAKDYLPLVQALADGKTIQFQSCGAWEDRPCDSETTFSQPVSKYRIKPDRRVRWAVYCGDVYLNSYSNVVSASLASDHLKECSVAKFVEELP